MNKFICSIISLLLLSCGAGAFDFEYEIKGGYSYVYADSENKVISRRDGGIVIDAKVISVASDFLNKYILVLRQPRVDIRVDVGSGEYYYDSYLEDKCEYWLIDTEADKVIGPYTEEKYIKIEKEIGIFRSDLSERCQSKKKGESRGQLERIRVE